MVLHPAGHEGVLAECTAWNGSIRVPIAREVSTEP
jgi:hypothetical protein